MIEYLRDELSPAATLHHEATTLLAEDPTLSARSPALQHSILGAIANGSITAGTISRRLRRPVSNLDPVLKRLIAAGFVIRHEDPLRAQRPTYALTDPILRFHYAILEPHGAMLRDRDPREVWDRLLPTFGSLVRGPVFKEQAREWVRRHADPSTLGGAPDRADRPPSSPPAGSSRSMSRRSPRAPRARPRSAGSWPSARRRRGRRREARNRRPDLELIDLERLYGGS